MKTRLHMWSAKRQSFDAAIGVLRDFIEHYNDVIMGTIASQITSITIIYSTVYSDADQRKRQSSASLAFVRGIHVLVEDNKCQILTCYTCMTT